MSEFDWKGLLRVGLTQLGLRPAEFWNLTPVELALLLGHPGAEAAMSRSALYALLMKYPDAAQSDKKDMSDG